MSNMTVGELRRRLEKAEPTLSICCQFGTGAMAINSMGVDDRDNPHMLSLSNSYLQKKPDVFRSETFTVERMQDLLAGFEPTLPVYCHFGDKSDNTAMPINAVCVNDDYSAFCLLNSFVQEEGEEIETYYEPSNEECEEHAEPKTRKT